VTTPRGLGSRVNQGPRRATAAGNQKGAASFVSSVAAPETAQGAAAANEEDHFDFQRQWYPVGVVSDFEWKVERREPIEVWLLGKRYVVWRKPKKASADEPNQWSVSLDYCPHRLAPLTEGRIEDDGDLMCSYHGWEFECGTGKCSSLPQAPDALASKITANVGRSGVQLLPVQEKYGLLWIWPDTSPEGLLSSVATESMAIPPLEALEDAETVTTDGHWYARDLLYDWDTFVENIVDPSHVPYAHHGIQGSRKKPMQFGLKLSRSERDSGVRGDLCPQDPALVNVAEEAAKHEGSFIEFRPPFLIRYNFQSRSSFGKTKEVDTKRAANLCIFGIPTKPGHCRVLFKFVIVNAGSLPKFARWLIARTPTWKDHQTRNKVFDSDAFLLYLQEMELAQGTKDGWKEKFFMPTSLDALVTGFRTWVDKFTNGGPYGLAGDTGKSAGAAAAAYTKREVMDRYEQHTKHCKACSGALRNTKILQVAALVACVVGACLRNLPLALASLAAAFYAEKWKQRFIFVDHIHAHQD